MVLLGSHFSGSTVCRNRSSLRTRYRSTRARPLHLAPVRALVRPIPGPISCTSASWATPPIASSHRGGESPPHRVHRAVRPRSARVVVLRAGGAGAARRTRQLTVRPLRRCGPRIRRHAPSGPAAAGVVDHLLGMTPGRATTSRVLPNTRHVISKEYVGARRGDRNRGTTLFGTHESTHDVARRGHAKRRPRCARRYRRCIRSSVGGAYRR